MLPRVSGGTRLSPCPLCSRHCDMALPTRVSTTVSQSDASAFIRGHQAFGDTDAFAYIGWSQASALAPVRD